MAAGCWLDCQALTALLSQQETWKGNVICAPCATAQGRINLKMGFYLELLGELFRLSTQCYSLKPHSRNDNKIMCLAIWSVWRLWGLSGLVFLNMHLQTMRVRTVRLSQILVSLPVQQDKVIPDIGFFCAAQATRRQSCTVQINNHTSLNSDSFLRAEIFVSWTFIRES